MSYTTPQAFRMALGHHLLAQAERTGIGLDRLRRRVLFERIISRLYITEPGRWVLKGGMALEIRLRDEARLTKDLDLGLRADIKDGVALRDRLIEALSSDPDKDRFVLRVGPANRLMEDSGGRATWRVDVRADLADKPFGKMQIDVSPRTYELTATDFMELPNSLGFAGISTPTIEVIDLDRHVAEKFHGMLKVFPDRENTRVRDLVLLHEHGLLLTSTAEKAIRAVWAERDDTPPRVFPQLPAGWPDRYRAMVAELDLNTTTFTGAQAVVSKLWAEMFDTSSGG